MKRTERRKQLKGFLEDLWTDIVKDPEKLDAFLDKWSGGFHKYSLKNTLLILYQKPDATLVSGYKTWKTKHNRQVRKKTDGITTIWIWCPRKYTKKVELDNGDEKDIESLYFTPCHVYDISDTDGDPVEVGCSDMVRGELNFDLVKSISQQKVIVKDLGLSNGSTDGKTNTITPKPNEVAMSGTLIHEISHNELGHVDGEFHEVEEMSAHEVEAESVKYIVLSHFGVKDDRAKFYIGNWNQFGAELEGRESKILQVAEKIIRRIENAQKVQA